MSWWELAEASADGMMTPWQLSPQAYLASLGSLVNFGSMGVGIIDPQKPMLDEILVSQGWLSKLLEQWCIQGHAHDPLLAQARQRGVCIMNRAGMHSQTALPIRQHLMCVMLPERLADRWWWLLLGRDEKAFTSMEQDLALLHLRQVQTAFNQATEPGMGRMIIGHDDRLIHADPNAQSWLLRSPEVYDQLTAHLHALVPQRWPALEPATGHDFAVALGGKPTWVCFHQAGNPQQPSAIRWHLETRTLGQDDLPLIGALDDSRIAQAVGYMHDHFQESPSLTQIAQAVHISPFHFHRLFTKQVGVSPKQYLQRKQLQAAKWLLRTTRMPIASVAVRSGFSSHGHFTSTFHRVIGQIPSSYRENQ